MRSGRAGQGFLEDLFEQERKELDNKLHGEGVKEEFRFWNLESRGDRSPAQGSCTWGVVDMQRDLRQLIAAGTMAFCGDWVGRSRKRLGLASCWNLELRT